MYGKDFAEAITRSADLGCYSPNTVNVFTNRVFLSGERMEKAKQVIQKVVGAYSIDEVMKSSFMVHSQLIDELSVALGCPITFTMGYVEFFGNIINRTSEDELKRLLSEGIKPNESLNIHTWLTLPSMEVIDANFYTRYATVCNQPEFTGLTVMKHADHLKGMRYVPQLIGFDFLETIGAMKRIGFDGGSAKVV